MGKLSRAITLFKVANKPCQQTKCKPLANLDHLLRFWSIYQLNLDDAQSAVGRKLTEKEVTDELLTTANHNVVYHQFLQMQKEGKGQ